MDLPNAVGFPHFPTSPEKIAHCPPPPPPSPPIFFHFVPRTVPDDWNLGPQHCPIPTHRPWRGPPPQGLALIFIPAGGGGSPLDPLPPSPGPPPPSPLSSSAPENLGFGNIF